MTVALPRLDALIRLGFAPLNGMHDEAQRFRSLGSLCGRDQPRHIGCELGPVGWYAIKCGEFLPDLPDGTPCQRDAPAQFLHALTFDPGGAGNTDKLVAALGEGGEIKTERLEDASVRTTPPVALALFIVADHEDPGFEQGAVERLHAR
jgi:hypothetical protein